MLALLCCVMRVRDSPVRTRLVDSFIKMNKSFFDTFCLLIERNDSKKDSFI